eukprot:c27517_g1_i1.p1 GENE.c27517_g1_i1~~c27517_g1_i1.p1  ORF type:complete len:227 (-),score=62.43 c27517_g1_i1:112-792(-)
MVFQGLLGCIPWSAMAFITLYFQYIGFSDLEASSIFSSIHLGGMFGSLFGGFLGDWMAKRLPDYGRVITAQISVLLGIPCVLILFLYIPQETSYGWAFTFTLFIQGCVCSWCSPGCNRPILSEIVDSESRSSVFAVLVALEGSSGALGAPLVGILSETAFGYQKSDQSVSEMLPEIRENNLNAISQAALYVMIIPWIMCFCLYGLMHFVYPEERKANNLRISSKVV